MPECEECGFKADSAGDFEPAFSLYHDIRCPKCGSTKCKHNREHADRITEAMNKAPDAPTPDEGS